MVCHCAFPEYLGGVGPWVEGCEAGWNVRGIVQESGDGGEVFRLDAGEEGGHDVGALGGVVGEFGKEVAAEVEGGAGDGDGGMGIADVECYDERPWGMFS